MDKAYLINILYKQIDEMNSILDTISESINQTISESNITEIINALEFLRMKTYITQICLDEIKQKIVSFEYLEKIVEDNKETLINFKNKMKEINK